MSKGNPAERLEDELDRAKARGRWLSDDEQAALDREADAKAFLVEAKKQRDRCLLYTSPSPRDRNVSRMPSSA